MQNEGQKERSAHDKTRERERQKTGNAKKKDAKLGEKTAQTENQLSKQQSNE